MSCCSSVMAIRAGVVASALVCLYSGDFARAQINPNPNPSSRIDIYGNARVIYTTRRDVGVFANEVQRGSLRAYQDIGRRRNQRGGVELFSLTADRYGALMAARRRPIRPITNTSLGYPILDPLAGLQTTPSGLAAAFSSYGGFGRRHASGLTDLETVLGRRYQLTGATALSAPVNRAIWRLGNAVSGSVAAHASTYDRATVPPPGPLGKSFETALSERVVAGQAELRVRAWSRFAEMEYRQAARAFETAAIMDSADVESRVGELYCTIATRAMGTAVVSLRTLARRHKNPFDSDVNVVDRFASEEEARRVRFATRLFAQSLPEAPAAQALHLFVLWFEGERGEQLSSAVAALRRVGSGTVFGEWPGLVESQVESQTESQMESRRPPSTPSPQS